MKPSEILSHYWGHNLFRPLQEEIINSVINQNDTIAILPTGGGKSICFQIPGIYFEGITLVISPLIALMNDQVSNLKARDISAIAFHSGLTKSEVEIEYSNIKNGKYKFVYVSPERIITERFKEIISLTPIKLLAIDEAHCISQWGHDFRPDYLLIAELRKILVDVPCIALTASATPNVLMDIKKYLLFNDKIVPFTQTIVRLNLSYVILNDENKIERLLKIANKVNGSGIVYVKNRKSTVQIASLLSKNGHKADFYHAGLELDERNSKQNDWQNGLTKIIVCTNAFGMGIDKSNVRFVVHYEIPDSLESYYQEAGRAGRDGSESWCVVLYSESDTINARKNLESRFLDKKSVQLFFNALCNHLQISYQSGFEQTYDMDVSQMSKKYSFSLPFIYTALDVIQKEGLIKLSDAYSNPSKLMILAENMELYRFYLANPNFELLIKTILRMYGGLFDNFIFISEVDIARAIKIPFDTVKKGLLKLHQLTIVDYIPQNEKPVITFLMPRPEIIPYNLGLWKNLKEMAFERFEALNKYVHFRGCRQQLLANYFGEKDLSNCGKCDNCRAIKNDFGEKIKNISTLLMAHFSENYCSFETILEKTGKGANTIKAIRFLMDSGKLVKNEEGNYKWK